MSQHWSHFAKLLELQGRKTYINSKSLLFMKDYYTCWEEYISEFYHSSIHLVIFWLLFQNVMSLHRIKAALTGLLDAGRVNEWIVTEKLGNAHKPNSTDKFKESSNTQPLINKPKTTQTNIWQRYMHVKFETIVSSWPINFNKHIVNSFFLLLDSIFQKFGLVCSCYHAVALILQQDSKATSSTYFSKALHFSSLVLDTWEHMFLVLSHLILATLNSPSNFTEVSCESFLSLCTCTALYSNWQIPANVGCQDSSNS